MRRVLRGIKNSKVETARVSVKLGPDTCGRRREGEWNIAMRQKKKPRKRSCVLTIKNLKSLQTI